MTPLATGRVVVRDGAYDLVFTRRFAAPITDVWASITEPDRTAKWFGRWEGEPGAGGNIRIQLGFEEGSPWADATIDSCDRPDYLAVTSHTDEGEWRMEIELTDDDGGTELTFTHHLDDATGVGDIGPGWEYYLDTLAASRDDLPLPDFADYYPAQSAHFTGQIV